MSAGAEDSKGRAARVEVTDLRLFLFANGIGILSIGVEAFGLGAADALWINESMRKVYPSSGRQVREGRVPSRMAFVVERNGATEMLAGSPCATSRMPSRKRLAGCCSRRPRRPHPILTLQLKRLYRLNYGLDLSTRPGDPAGSRKCIRV